MDGKDVMHVAELNRKNVSGSERIYIIWLQLDISIIISGSSMSEQDVSGGLGELV
jgi:hypothetical protein